MRCGLTSIIVEARRGRRFRQTSDEILWIGDSSIAFWTPRRVDDGAIRPGAIRLFQHQKSIQSDMVITYFNTDFDITNDILKSICLS